MRYPLGLLGMAAAAALLPACNRPPPTLTVAAAASLERTLRLAAPPNVQIQYTFAASSLIVQQAASGAPIDVVITADLDSQDRLVQGGLVRPGDPQVLMTNAVVLLVRPGLSDKVHAVSDLEHLSRIALCEPAVPIGHYAREALTQAGVPTEALHTVIEPDVRGVVSVVDGGDADAGFVYGTDAVAAQHARTALTLPGMRARYGISVMTQHTSPQATDFVRWLLSPEAQKVFRHAGFGPP